MVIIQQVLKGVPDDLAVWLRERKSTSLDELGDYTLTRKREVIPNPGADPGFGEGRGKSSLAEATQHWMHWMTLC